MTSAIRNSRVSTRQTCSSPQQANLLPRQAILAQSRLTILFGHLNTLSYTSILHLPSYPMNVSLIGPALPGMPRHILNIFIIFDLPCHFLNQGPSKIADSCKKTASLCTAVYKGTSLCIIGHATQCWHSVSFCRQESCCCACVLKGMHSTHRQGGPLSLLKPFSLWLTA